MAMASMSLEEGRPKRRSVAGWRRAAFAGIGCAAALTVSAPAYGFVPISTCSTSSTGSITTEPSLLMPVAEEGSGSAKIADFSASFNRFEIQNAIFIKFWLRMSYRILTPIKLFWIPIGVPDGPQGSGCVGSGPLYGCSCQLSLEKTSQSSVSNPSPGSLAEGAARSYLIDPNGCKSPTNKSESLGHKFRGAVRLRRAMISSFCERIIDCWVELMLSSKFNNNNVPAAPIVTPIMTAANDNIFLQLRGSSISSRMPTATRSLPLTLPKLILCGSQPHPKCPKELRSKATGY
jgi:hypothetical protein